MIKTVFVILCISASLILSKTSFVFASSEQTLYYRTKVPEEWKLWKDEYDQEVSFTLALKQRNLDLLEQMFWENSNPQSAQFAKNVPREEIVKLVAPEEEVQTLIIEWLESAAKEFDKEIKIKNMRDSIHVTTSANLIKHLFQTQMHSFINSKNNGVAFKHLGPIIVPSHIAPHIDLITGITEFPPSTLRNHKSYSYPHSDSALDNQCNIPDTIKQLYDIPKDVLSNPNANIAIYGQYIVNPNNPSGFSAPSLEQFQKANDLPDTPINCILGNAAKYYSPNGYDGESALDVQMVQGIAEGVNTCFYVMQSTSGWMLEFTTDIFHTPETPTVVSISYGLDEVDQCDDDVTPNAGNCTELHIPNYAAYMARTNVEFMKLGLAGFSIIVASGDDGSGSDCTQMKPIFPASSPYVTTVGGTTIEPSSGSELHFLDTSDLPPVCTDPSYGCNCTTSLNEQPCLQNNSAQFPSGGGFSDSNPMPEYQKKVVEDYLNSGVTLPSSYFNTSGRAYPDVAALGANFCVIDNFNNPNFICDLVSGTSASAPLWAGLVAILNQDRLDAGKTTLGFLNQILYQMYEESPSKYFNNQFEEGNNADDECPNSNGYSAKAGYWTPLTGLGSPRFAEIRQYVANLP